MCKPVDPNASEWMEKKKMTSDELTVFMSLTFIFPWPVGVLPFQRIRMIL